MTTKRDRVLYSVGDAARVLGVSPSSVLAWCRTGRVVHTRTIGGLHLIRQAEIDRLAEERGRRAAALVLTGAEPEAVTVRR